MIKLLAIAADDGWAFIENGEGIFLFKPPYQDRDLLPVKDDALDEAVERHGFSRLDQDFESWSALIKFIRDEMVSARKALGQEIDLEQIRDLLDFAPPYILKEYLDKIETEWMSKQRWRMACSFLGRILQLDQIKRNDELKSRAEDLLSKCAEQLVHHEKDLHRIVDIKRVCGRAARKLSTQSIQMKMEQVAREGVINAVGN